MSGRAFRKRDGCLFGHEGWPKALSKYLDTPRFHSKIEDSSSDFLLGWKLPFVESRPISPHATVHV